MVELIENFKDFKYLKFYEIYGAQNKKIFLKSV